MSDSSAGSAQDFLSRIMGAEGLESASGTEAFLPSVRPAMTDERMVKTAADKLSKRVALDPSDRFALEAIIIPDRRPAILVQDGDYTVTHKEWLHLNDAHAKDAIKAAIASVGRVELPDHPQIPYGGTAFVVGDGILMTNRHVAEIFSNGLGLRNLRLIAGRTAGVDFGQEFGATERNMLGVREVLMIHPFWDMALLRVDGLGGHPALVLSIVDPEEMIGEEIAVIGYPAFDPRNDPRVQDKVFGGVYNVKRLQPGRIGAGKGRARQNTSSFGKSVSAMMHDASTLGGNSGSVAFHPATGQVVGLHFAGIYLDANYAVPAFELARDGRIINAGVNFSRGAQAVPGTSATWWRKAGDDYVAANSRESRPPSLPADGSLDIVIPLEISVRLGAAQAPDSVRVTVPRGGEKRSGSSDRPATSERNAIDLTRGPLTFPSRYVSLFQSVAEAVAAKSAGLESVGGLEAPQASAVILAAEAVAANEMAGISTTEAPFGIEEMSVRDYAAECAGLAMRLLKAKMTGNAAAAEEIDGKLNSGVCDPKWAETIKEYYAAYGAWGTGDARQYVTAAKLGNRIVPIKDGARIALIGDWGTGAGPARRILELVRDQNPDILIHLGDIYYSGTTEECQGKFISVVDSVFDRKSNPLPIYSLCGNHDMYCGGVGYYGMIKQLNKGKLAQGASFFCLRAQSNAWQILAMDTGRNDFSPLSVNDAVTHIEPDEEAWLCRRVQEFSGKTILLSHHQLFSAFSTIGPKDARGAFNPVNPNLERTWHALRGAAAGKIPAWFWGHEHNQCIYEPYRDLPLGRCIGHGAIPVAAREDAYDVPAALADPPAIHPGTKLHIEDDYYTHGFAMLTLRADGVARAEYFEDLNGNSSLLYGEDIK